MCPKNSLTGFLNNMKACIRQCITAWLVLLTSVCMGCSWVSYVEQGPIPGFSEPIPRDPNRSPIEVQLSIPGVSLAAWPEGPSRTSPLLEGFKQGVAALEPYRIGNKLEMSTISTLSTSKPMGGRTVCRLDVSTNDAQLNKSWRIARALLYGLTLNLIPLYEEEREYTLALKLLVDYSPDKTGTYVVKERKYRWFFAVLPPSFLSGEWTRVPGDYRLGVILGQATAAFCANR